MFKKVLIANRGAIALPHHPHSAPHGRRLGRRLLHRRPQLPTRRPGRRSHPPRRRRRLSQLSFLRQPSSPPAAQTGVRRHPPRLWLPLGERRLRPRLRRARHPPSSAPPPRTSTAFALKHTARAHRAVAAASLCSPAPASCTRLADALAQADSPPPTPSCSRAPAAGGGHRHEAPAHSPAELTRGLRLRHPPRPIQLRQLRRLPRSASSPVPATSRSRSSATARGERHRPRRTRLLHPAPPSEGPRRDPRPRPH